MNQYAVMEIKKPQVEQSHYGTPYDHKARWLSYWYQIRAVDAFSPVSVAEIGIGNGLVSWYLEQHGMTVTTIDSDATLNPRIHASVSNIPCADSSFDVSLAAEVLEHMPFDESERAIKELYRVSRMGAVISVPDSRRTLIRAHMSLPFFGSKEIFCKIDTQRIHTFDGQHYWEIGKKGFSLQKIIDACTAAGFMVMRHFVPFDVPTKHFFILKK